MKQKDIYGNSEITLKGILLRLVIFLTLGVICSLLDKSGVYIYRFGAAEADTGYSIMYYLAFVCFCGAGYSLSSLMVYAQIKSRKGTPGEITMVSKLLKSMAVIVGLLGIALVLGKLSAVSSALSAFAAMMLGWSLQAPVSGIAAWIMVTIIRPYKIGDRIQLPSYGLTGDIIKFSPMYLSLNQVGGTVGGEEPSGRILHVPNALLFSAIIINSTYQQKEEAQAYILDEVVFRITLDSDWDTAEQIVLNAAKLATADIIQATGIEPYVRAETWDYGTIFRVRYMTDAIERPKYMHEIVKMATKEFQTNKNVDLVIPFLYSFKRGAKSTLSKSDPENKIERIEIEKIKSGDNSSFEEILFNNQIEINTITQSIAKKGLLQPIVVNRNLESDDYTIVFGEKRLLACKQLGWKDVPCIVNNPLGIEVSVPPEL